MLAYANYFPRLLVIAATMPLVWWFTDCRFAWINEFEARCFSANRFLGLILLTVIGLMVLYVWLKYKKQICDCDKESKLWE